MHFLHNKKWKVVIMTALLSVVFATCAFATKVTADVNVNLHKKTSSSSEVVGVMKKGLTRTVLKTSSTGNWYKVKVNGVTGYVRRNYVSIVGEAENSQTSTTSSSSTSASTTFRNNVCKMAKELLGSDYVYGAAGPTEFDCSGFCQYIYKQCGKSIPRTSADQYASAKKVSKENLKKGYLVFFSSTAGGTSVSHVGIYIGNGKMIHAANSNSGVITSDLDSKYYTEHYVGAGRYVIN